nr:hypothetical protein Q903MT_gene6385 [Picea sitchensis]
MYKHYKTSPDASRLANRSVSHYKTLSNEHTHIFLLVVVRISQIRYKFVIRQQLWETITAYIFAHLQSLVIISQVDVCDRAAS